jgi:hypothetical protein
MNNVFCDASISHVRLVRGVLFARDMTVNALLLSDGS